MSLEIKIEELTKAVIGLTELIGKIEAGKNEPVAAPVIVTYTPEDQAAAKVAVEALAPVMPAAPVFEAPVAAPATSKAPFTDGKSLITYVMDTYKQLGAEKGAGIQNVLVTLGFQNINDVTPDKYDALYQGVEELKG